MPTDDAEQADSERKLPDAKQWLSEHGFADVAAQIAEIEAEWARAGKKTRRNWWDVLAGGPGGKPRVVAGRTFPVIEQARQRQELARATAATADAQATQPAVTHDEWGPEPAATPDASAADPAAQRARPAVVSETQVPEMAAAQPREAAAPTDEPARPAQGEPGAGRSGPAERGECAALARRVGLRVLRLLRPQRWLDAARRRGFGLRSRVR